MAGNAAQDEVYILWSVHFWKYEESMVKLENECGYWFISVANEYFSKKYDDRCDRRYF